MIRFMDVSAQYTEAREAVFEHWNETVGDGEFVLVTGESGAGKSTLVKLLLRELTPAAGRILVDGQDIAGLTRKQLPHYRRQFGVVFQDFRLIPRLNAYENVRLARVAAGGRERDADQMICSLFSLLGIEQLHKRYPAELSGGQQQKVCLARAMINHPKYLLADEPTGNLDPAAAREIMVFLELVKRQGTTVIAVTHDPAAAQGLDFREIRLKPSAPGTPQG